MDRLPIQIGPPDAGQGDDLFAAFTKIETNFTRLFAAEILGSPPRVASPGGGAAADEVINAAWVLDKLTGVAGLNNVAALQPVFEAAKLLAGEAGVAFDFLAREVLINDYAGVLTRSARPSSVLTVARASPKWTMGRDGLLAQTSANTLAYDHSPATGEPLGVLIEPAATNQMTSSADMDALTKTAVTVDTNVATAPDGTLTADFIKETTAAASQHRVTKSNAAINPSETVVFSCYFKAGSRTIVSLAFLTAGLFTTGAATTYFDLVNGVVISGVGQMERYPNGWWRCWISSTATSAVSARSVAAYLADGAGNVTYDGDGVSGLYAWGAQLELGTTPSSYIPTTAAAVTRAADNISVATGTLPLSLSRGTIIAEFRQPVSASAAQSLLSLHAGSTANEWMLRAVSGPDKVRGYGTTGGVVVADVDPGTITLGARQRVALAYQAGDLAMSLNGAAPVAAAPASLIAPTTLVLGSSAAGLTWRGHLRRIALTSRRVTNAELPVLAA